MSNHESDLPSEQEQVRHSDYSTRDQITHYGGIIMFFMGFMQLIRATIYGTSGNLGAMLMFATFSMTIFILTLWYTGFFNHILENTDQDSLRQQADERANREGRAPSWHPDNL